MKFKFPLTLSLIVCSILLACSPQDKQTATLAPGDTVKIAIMSTTDIHGWLLPFDYATDQSDERYGLAKVATLVDSVRNVHQHSILIDAGDLIQGNQFAEYFARVAPDSPSFPLIDAMEKMRFDAVVVGNHEFNFGMDYLDKRIGQTSIPFLGANVYRSGTEEPYFEPWIIVNAGGVQIGIVGLTTPGSAVWDRPRTEGIVDFADGVEAAHRWVTDVRAAGAEFVVILAHTALGPGSSYDANGVAEENFARRLAEEVDGIDLLAIGHSHRVTEGLVIEGPGGSTVPVVQSGRWGSHLGISTFQITRNEEGFLETLDYEVKVSSVLHAESHPAIVRLAEDVHERVRSHVNEALATTPDTWDASRARLEDHPIVDLIHEVQLKVTGAQLSAAAAFNTNARFGPGAITRRDMAAIYPFENMLYKMEITGAQLRAFLEHTSQYFEGVSNGAPAINRSWPGFNFDTIAGADYTLDLRRSPGNRVTRLNVDGKSVRDDDVFTIAVNSYRAEGGGGFTMLHDAPVVWESDQPVRSYMEEFLREKQHITHQDVFTRNWRLEY